ncbi:hypothetical protein NPIL_641231 [Nephila pilipes]|uniref:Uncharacterized protein n=1 Tax=Nephila pilipes TaxID=299642 RepID=A0A8X6MN49_NEPPI|nr:hypothetical protein NPIL_641231 [Nephila pilipes]
MQILNISEKLTVQSIQYCLWTRKKRRDTSCMTGTGLRDSSLPDKRAAQQRINEENVVLFPPIADGWPFAVRDSDEAACERCRTCL